MTTTTTITTAQVTWLDEWRAGFVATPAGGMYFTVEDDPEPIEDWLGEPCPCGHDEHVGVVITDEAGTTLESLWGICAYDDNGYADHEYWRTVAAQLAGCDDAEAIR